MMGFTAVIRLDYMGKVNRFVDVIKVSNQLTLN